MSDSDEAVESSVAATPPAPAGWYDAPEDPSTRQYWDGENWRPNLKCGSCGSILAGDVCASCGARNTGGPLVASVPLRPVARSTPPEEKSVGLALLLNFLWPGMGHIYANVKTEFGIIMAVISGINAFLFITLIWIPFGIILWAIIAPWTMIDVNRELKRIDS
jgi:hypothetical protein